MCEIANSNPSRPLCRHRVPNRLGEYVTGTSHCVVKKTSHFHRGGKIDCLCAKSTTGHCHRIDLSIAFDNRRTIIENNDLLEGLVRSIVNHITFHGLQIGMARDTFLLIYTRGYIQLYSSSTRSEFAWLTDQNGWPLHSSVHGHSHGPKRCTHPWPYHPNR